MQQRMEEIEPRPGYLAAVVRWGKNVVNLVEITPLKLSSTILIVLFSLLCVLCVCERDQIRYTRWIENVYVSDILYHTQ